VTRGELIDELVGLLGARHEARFIVEDALGPGRAGVGPDAAGVARARALAGRRCAGEPLQYALGHWSFRQLDLLVDPRVLIPRPETEQVVQVALGELGRLGVAAPVLVDAGTGSGAIALSLAAELAISHPEGRVFATDASAPALALAGQNRRRTSEARPILPVTLVEGSWLSPLPPELAGGVTMVVANPPYVSPDEWDRLQPEVRCEPRSALVASAGSDGTPGLAGVEAVLDQARRWLSRPGTVVIELAPHQEEAGRALARAMGYLSPFVAPDLARRPRALVGRLA
jgi:release factor glutamine methyltransferase